LTNVQRWHPSNWPLALWVVLSLVGGLLRVQYTLAAFSFAPAVALLAGTWLGWRRGALVQAIAAAALVPTGLFFPEVNSAAELGFRLGLIASAALAGIVATADHRGAHPPPWARFAVFGAAGASAALVLVILPGRSAGGGFALVFLLATTIAAFYAYRIVPEPGRVIGYVFCLLPYYVLGTGWDLLVARFMPATAALAGIPDGWDEVLLHAYFARLPSELISVVVVAYLVCALDRGDAATDPMAIGASR
jgi:hypothetical protein